MISPQSYHSLDDDTRELSLNNIQNTTKEEDDAHDNYSEDFEDGPGSKASTPISNPKSSKSSIRSSRSSSSSSSSVFNSSSNKSNIEKNEKDIPIDNSNGVHDSPKSSSSSHVSHNSSNAKKSSSKKSSIKSNSSRSSRSSNRKSSSSRKSSSPASNMSSISKDDVNSQSARGKIDQLMDRLRGKNKDVTKEQTPVAAASLPPTNQSYLSVAAPTPDNEKITITTREELNDLIANNDELRIKLLETERAENHANRTKKSNVNTTRSSSGRRQQYKTAQAIQKSLRREWTRQDLRGERESLLAERNELRAKLASKKKLHGYFSLIEECKADIARLTDERRALALAIRQNEKILITREADQESQVASRRLVDAIKADAVLTQRSLEKARRDTSHVMKLHQEAQQRVQKLEEQLEQAENENASGETDPELRELQKEYKQKSQTVQRLKAELREIRTASVTTARRGSEERASRGEKMEIEFLTERVRQLRAELAAREATITKTKTTTNSNSSFKPTRSPSHQETKSAPVNSRRTSNEQNKRNENEKAAELRNESKRPSVTAERRASSAELESLKRRVEEQRRESFSAKSLTNTENNKEIQKEEEPTKVPETTVAPPWFEDELDDNNDKKEEAVAYKELKQKEQNTDISQLYQEPTNENENNNKSKNNNEDDLEDEMGEASETNEDDKDEEDKEEYSLPQANATLEPMQVSEIIPHEETDNDVNAENIEGDNNSEDEIEPEEKFKEELDSQDEAEAEVKAKEEHVWEEAAPSAPTGEPSWLDFD